MSDHNQSETLRAFRILGMFAGWMGATRTGPAAEIISKCLPANVSENPDGKETLELLRRWLQALEDSATGESKEAMQIAGKSIDDAIAKQEPGASLSFDAVMTVFLAGLSGGAEVDRQVQYVERKAETQKRKIRIRDAVRAEMQSGEHKSVTSARKTVAERMEVSLKTVQNASKNI